MNVDYNHLAKPSYVESSKIKSRWSGYKCVTLETIIVDRFIIIALSMVGDLGRVTKKPVFGVSDQVLHKPSCTATGDG